MPYTAGMILQINSVNLTLHVPSLPYPSTFVRLFSSQGTKARRGGDLEIIPSVLEYLVSTCPVVQLYGRLI